MNGNLNKFYLHLMVAVNYWKLQLMIVSMNVHLKLIVIPNKICFLFLFFKLLTCGPLCQNLDSYCDIL